MRLDGEKRSSSRERDSSSSDEELELLAPTPKRKISDGQVKPAKKGKKTIVITEDQINIDGVFIFPYYNNSLYDATVPKL